MLSDDETLARLREVHDLLGNEGGATTRSDTALKAARKAIQGLMFGLELAIENAAQKEGR